MPYDLHFVMYNTDSSKYSVKCSAIRVLLLEIDAWLYVQYIRHTDNSPLKVTQRN